MNSHRATATASLFVALCGQAIAADPNPAPVWCLIVEHGESRRAVRLDNGAVTEVKVGVGRLADTEPMPGEQRTIFHVMSPDQKRILYEMTSGTARQNHVISIADADGKNLRPIANVGHSTRPAWSPDGKHVAFVSERADRGRHVYRIDIDGRNEKQISREPVERGCRPGFTADGRVVFTVDRGREGKMPLMDVVIGDGAQETVLMKRQDVINSATSADGNRLAVAVPGELALYDLKTGAVQKFPMKDVNPQWHVTFTGLNWRPDSRAVALSFGFLGGKQAVTHLEGEDHVGVLSLDAAKPVITTYKVGNGYGLMAWVTDDDLRRRK